MTMTFGEKLLSLRQRARMSQDALAEKLNVSRQAVSKWERDEAMPETDNVIRIAQIFTVYTDYLLLSDPQPTPQQTTSHVQSFNGDRIERFIRRHGYKAGYFLMAGGAFLCIIALLVMLLLPNFGSGIFDMGSNMGGSSNNIIIEGDGIDEDLMEDTMADMYGPGWNSGFLDPFDKTMNQMQKTWRSSVSIMAALIGVPLLLVGIALLVLGSLIVTKGKKLVAQTV
jgi:transcriptional regulator with XRE-family HTH domain